jgi:nitroreductase
MSFIEIAKKRYSARNYKNQPVEEEKLSQILEAGRVAPSATNAQPVHFIVLKEKGELAKICEAYGRDWIKAAPLIIAVCGDKNKAWKHRDGTSYYSIDVAIAVDHMTLEATDLGLGSCWVCAFDKVKAAEILQIPAGIEPLVLLPIGYQEENPDLTTHNTRKSLSEIVHYGKF